METLQKIDSTLDSMQTEEVEYLYHYTSIESLALILKNKTIRLNPLDKMDDLQEQKTADVENLGMHCDAGFRKDLQKVYDSHREEKYEYNVVNFNFTNTVDIFWDVLPYNAFWHTIFYPNLRTKEPQHFRIDDKKGKVYHIHGTLDREMITGVGEPRQLVNTIYQNNEEIISVSVKPAINENCKNGIENRVSELIDSTDVFVVYGMSIGRTDVKWWKRVVQRLLTCENTYLLIVNYDKDYNKALPYTTSLVANKIITNLIEVSECPLEHQDRIRDKIAVLLNTELFKYGTLVEKLGSAALMR